MLRSVAILLFLLSFAFTEIVAQRSTSAPPPISVPDINGLAVDLVKPAFPETALAADADGSVVSLKVIVDEDGNVISAICSLNCHPMLKDAAELAAASSRFTPLFQDGRAVRYEGILLYTFVVERVNWFRFGTALESTRQFDNISLGPVAQILSARYDDEKALLLSLDANGGVDYDARQNGIRKVELSIKTKLKGRDLWNFEIGMALRRVTFWTMAGERTNRSELQAALDELPAYVSSAPEGVPEQTLRDLTTLSKYRVRSDLPEQELREAIRNLAKNIRID